MNNRGFVDLELGERTYRLKFTFEALDRAEERLGKPITVINEQNVGMREIGTLFWAALLYDNPTMTYRQTTKIIDEHIDQFKEIATKTTEALKLYFPGQKTNDDPN